MDSVSIDLDDRDSMERHTLDALALAVAKSEAERIIHIADQHLAVRGHKWNANIETCQKYVAQMKAAAERIKAEVERTNEADHTDE